jgi:tetratricopeptide (TPR) repeat protein
MFESQLVPKSRGLTDNQSRGLTDNKSSAAQIQATQAIPSFGGNAVTVAVEDFDADLKVSAEVATFITNAKVLMKHGEYSLALNILRQASNRDSYNVITLGLLADCLEEQKKPSEALVARKAVVNMDYGFESVFKLGNLHYKMGDDHQALEKFYDALALLTEESEHLFEIYKNMGNIFVRQGDFDAAEEKYSKAYTLNSQSDVLLVNFGTLEVQRNDFDKSLFCFRQAVDVNVDNDRAWVGLAMVHNHFGDVDLAWANVENALDINPKNRTAVHLIANWAVRDHKMIKGIEALEEYLSTIDQDEDMSLVLINLYCSSSQMAKAEMEIERVLLWNPGHPEVRELRKKIRKMKTMAAA